MVSVALLALAASGNLTFPDGGLPTPRPMAYTESGGKQIIGGLDGLYIGSRASWILADTNSTKQLEVDSSGAVWVRRGDGAIDKLDLKQNRHWHDVLFGSSRRPWSSAIGMAGPSVLFGGLGGWIEKTPKGDFVESYPTELKGQIVTCLFGHGKDRWIGTQQGGLWHFGPGKPIHYGLAAGLDDRWITGICNDGKQLWIGLADAGVATLKDGVVAKIEAPFQRVRSLTLWKGGVVVSTDMGAYQRQTGNWKRLTERESNGVIPGKRLALLEPNAIEFR